MKYLDLTLPTPAENLALDEALLDESEAGARRVPSRSSHDVQPAAGGDRSRSDEGILRFWEAREYFVVVGYSNKVATEVNVAACRTRSIPILRRCSGGGTVLQGPGCLNYALVLGITKDGPLASLSGANRFIMERNCAAVDSALPTSHSAIAVRGHTDLAIDGRKFSGNSQRRRRRFLLFHGSFLLNFDLPLISDLLRMPSKQPDYRQNRGHTDFLTNLGIAATEMKVSLRKAWSATESFQLLSLKSSMSPIVEKYSADAWNLKF